MVLTMYLCCVGGSTITYPHTHTHTHTFTACAGQDTGEGCLFSDWGNLAWAEATCTQWASACVSGEAAATREGGRDWKRGERGKSGGIRAAVDGVSGCHANCEGRADHRNGESTWIAIQPEWWALIRTICRTSYPIFSYSFSSRPLHTLLLFLFLFFPLPSPFSWLFHLFAFLSFPFIGHWW